MEFSIVSDHQKHEPAFLTFLDAVKRVGLHPKTSRNWLDAGKFPLPVQRINGCIMVPAVAVTAFIDAATESSLDSLPEEMADFFRGEIRARKAQPTPEAPPKGKPGRRVRGGAGAAQNQLKA